MALDIITKLNLDMKAPNAEIAYANQYDSAGYINAQLLNDGEKWAVPSGAVAVVSYMKSDRIGGYYDTTAIGETAVAFVDSSDRSLITIALDAQTMTTVGNVSMQVNFYQNNQRLSTFVFILNVKASPINSSNIDSKWFGNLLILSGVVVDNTLSISGAAADAKVAGNRLEGIEQDLNNEETRAKAAENLKVNKPLTNPNGTNGQLLRTLGNGNTEWVDQGTPTSEQVETAVETWLDDHPEATTTVEDHSLTHEKLVLDTINYVTPEMFGAVGDGETDDTNAISTAFASKKTVLLKSNTTYLLTERITLQNDTLVIGGTNSVLKWAAYPTDRTDQLKLRADARNNITFENVIFDFGSQEVLAHDITLFDSSFVKFVNCRFCNSYGSTFRLNGSDHVLIQGCHFEDVTGAAGNPGECIFGSNFHDVQIIDCTCKNIGDHFVYADGSVELYNLVISGCICEDTGVNGLTNGAAICLYSNAHDITVSDCVITPVGNGFYIGAHGDSTLVGNNILISNCTVQGGATGIAINGISEDYLCEGVKIVGCAVSNASLDGIDFRWCKNAVISNCLIENAARNCFSVDSFYNSIITDIHIKNVTGAAAGLIIGSGRTGGHGNNVIIDNVFLSGNPESKGLYPLYVRRGTNYTIGNVVEDDNFQNSSIYPAGYGKPISFAAQWTPTVAGGNISGNVTFSSGRSWYAIAGKLILVYCEGKISEANEGKYLLIGGIPRTVDPLVSIGNCTVSNTGKIGQGKIGMNGTVPVLTAYFTEQNPLPANGTFVISAIGLLAGA